jgi:hypothetical protein
MASRIPQIRKGGKEAIDKLLSESVARRDTPALFFLATNAKETIYCNQDGEVVFGDEGSGKVNADTSTWPFFKRVARTDPQHWSSSRKPSLSHVSPRCSLSTRA